jgi:tetratricopeptide (TPR) repeat protein
MNDLQTILHTEGPAAAFAWCRQRLDAEPHDATTWRHLGQLHALARELPQAMDAGLRACELAPQDPRAFSDLGRIHALQGDFAAAARCCEHAVHIDPTYAEGWHNLGTALKKLGAVDTAFAAFRQALHLDAQRADTYLNLGNLLIAAGQFNDAVECFERAARLDPSLAQARSMLADQLSTHGKVKRAEELFRQALGLDPERIDSWFGLGRTLEDLGQAEGALGCYLNVLSRQPQHPAALGQYLALVRDEPNSAILADAQTALQNEKSNDEGQALIGYGLLKFYDRRKEYKEAARIGTLANALRRRQAGALDRDALARRVDALITHYPKEFFAARQHWGDSSRQPVFIVGLPRSGTTLTEQIMAAHPMMHGAGELTDLSRLASTCAGDEEPWRAALMLDAAQSRTHAQDYLQVLRDGAASDVFHISDKSPLNFFQLAFAALLFPHAKVVHCVRDARDNALSIWMENFNPDQRYATDFSDLAFHRQQYLRLMAHWRKHLPLPIHEIRYEDTVADLERQARGLVAFLGLPWDKACLEFHRSERAVQTPSRWQVRQPIYSRSVQRWRQYAPWLPGLETAFHEPEPAI